ncbi:MAG: REP-associated tyrosine transposase [Peptostreptococcaceae bacterium]
MATPKRIWYEGATYHVTARGNHRENIFIEDGDYMRYLDTLNEAVEYYEEYNYEVISYCLMTNHVHLLIRTGTKPLGNLISRIHSRYTKYFNYKYDCVGHLFQGRYHGELIKDERQLYETIRYIHLNPVRANIVNDALEYEYSKAPPGMI